jgi:DNA invertase Pin-like site-specific DNA recombinase
MTIIRIACYIRVSTQEQKLHGISLDAQRDKLREYAEKHGLKIVGWYEDEGISGRKLIKHRPALQRMLRDAQAGKFDRIIFIKLDRFFRSVAEYHECMKMIEPVVWTATEEKYDLATANGRAFVNMKLTIAELEADQTGERIDLVNEYKVKTGQALTGKQNQLYGYTVQKIDGFKRVVKDAEKSHIVDDYINHFLTHNNKRQAYLYIKDKYNLDIEYKNISKILTDTKLYGHFRGNDNYITDPYVDKATFDKIQELLGRNLKRPPTNRTYLYSGLIPCPHCGRLMSGKFTKNTKILKRSNNATYSIEYHSYRCNNHNTNAICDFNKQVNEAKIEKYLLSNFNDFVSATITEASVLDNRADVDNELINKQIKSVKGEMGKLKRMYRKEDIDEAEYDEEMEILKNELKVLEDKLIPMEERDLSIYEELVKSDWKDLYNVLNKENKRAFWRKYIKAIELNSNGTVKGIIFF